MLSYRMRAWVEMNNIVPRSQNGFRKGMSCADNLTKLKLYLEHAVNDKMHTLAVFIDVVMGSMMCLAIY